MVAGSMSHISQPPRSRCGIDWRLGSCVSHLAQRITNTRVSLVRTRLWSPQQLMLHGCDALQRLKYYMSDLTLILLDLTVHLSICERSNIWH
jgi:hypothetical protein